jgi:hypothetical protein
MAEAVGMIALIVVAGPLLRLLWALRRFAKEMQRVSPAAGLGKGGAD